MCGLSAEPDGMPLTDALKRAAFVRVEDDCMRGQGRTDVGCNTVRRRHKVMPKRSPLGPKMKRVQRTYHAPMITGRGLLNSCACVVLQSIDMS